MRLHDIPKLNAIAKNLQEVTPNIFKHYCVDIFFQILVLQEYWILTESRILLKAVLGCVRNVALSISSHEQTQ